jgi:hypothetical protein
MCAGLSLLPFVIRLKIKSDIDEDIYLRHTKDGCSFSFQEGTMLILQVFSDHFRPLLPDGIIDEAIRAVDTARLVQVDSSLSLQKEYLDNLDNFKEDIMRLILQFLNGNVTRQEIRDQLSLIYTLALPHTPLA